MDIGRVRVFKFSEMHARVCEWQRYTCVVTTTIEFCGVNNIVSVDVIMDVFDVGYLPRVFQIFNACT